MSTEGNLNLNSKKEYIDIEEKKLKENNYLRQFNTNFESFKKSVNERLYKRDKEETAKLNEIAQPKFVYNNFPLILGIIFILFGIFIFLTNQEDNLYYKAPLIDLIDTTKTKFTTNTTNTTNTKNNKNTKK
jgi:low temperature requirement protein LtrA